MTSRRDFLRGILAGCGAALLRGEAAAEAFRSTGRWNATEVALDPTAPISWEAVQVTYLEPIVFDWRRVDAYPTLQRILAGKPKP